MDGHKAKDTLASGFAGLLGSSVGKGLLHPVDTLKAKLQVVNKNTGPKIGLGQMVKQTMSTEGLMGFYRGYGIHVLGSVPAGGLYFGSYEVFKNHTLENDFFKEHPFLAYLAGGMFAEIVACTIFVPVDVIKERRQV